MSAQQGQTDSILKVTLPSTILHARWLDDHVAKGGKARLEVATFYVGEGAPIKLTFKDLSGKTVGTLEGKVVSNLHRTAFAPNADNMTGGMTFEAELPKHGLKARGGAIKVWPPVEFTDLKFLDKDGKKELKEIKEGIPAGCEAKVKNLKDGEKVLVSVYLRTDMVMQDGRLFAETLVPVKSGKVHLGFGPKIHTALDKLKIQLELDKEGGKYFQPEYVFAVSALGTRKVSEPVKVVQELNLHFWEIPGLAGLFEGKQVQITHPDGKKEKQAIPKDGIIAIKKSKPGKLKIEVDKGVPAKTAEAGKGRSSLANDKGHARQDKPIETHWTGSRGRPLARQNDFNDLISAAAKKYDIEPLLLKALIWKESAFDPKAANSVGYAGLTQIGGGAIKEAGLSSGKTKKEGGKYIYDFEGDERFDPEKSINGGAKILSMKRAAIQKKILSKFKAEISYTEQMKFVLGAYNGGQGTIIKAWVYNGGIDCLWEDLITSEPGTPSALYQAIPVSWGPEKKQNEISRYPVLILEKMDS